MSQKWQMVYCDLCDYKTYTNRPKTRLRQHLYNKHGTKEELRKIRNEVLDLKACARAIKLISKQQSGDSV